ncbi:reverse transcriptase [Senna tora]|uniref:Reverse transcriptase n=1 Tax=Senna tora TaxID=362788 RepID=A0A834STW1_9FABA|nr:reverse transcriptase [Senna tora]
MADAGLRASAREVEQGQPQQEMREKWGDSMEWETVEERSIAVAETALADPGSETPATRLLRTTTAIKELIVTQDQIFKEKKEALSRNQVRGVNTRGKGSIPMKNLQKENVTRMNSKLQMGGQLGKSRDDPNMKQNITFGTIGTLFNPNAIEVSKLSFKIKDNSVSSPNSKMADDVSPKSNLRIELSDKEKEAIHKPWENALIIRHWGKIFDKLGLGKRISEIWKLKVPPQLVNIGLGFLVMIPGCIKDRWKALLAGIIHVEGHFLYVRPWVPCFNPAHALREAFSSVPMPANIVQDGFHQQILVEGLSGFCMECGGTNHASMACHLSKLKEKGDTIPVEVPSEIGWRVVECRRKNTGKKDTVVRKTQISNSITASRPSLKAQTGKEMDLGLDVLGPRPLRGGKGKSQDFGAVEDLNISGFSAKCKHKQSEPSDTYNTLIVSPLQNRVEEPEIGNHNPPLLLDISQFKENYDLHKNTVD